MKEFYNRDCMEGMAEYPDKYFDLAIVDPEQGKKQDGRIKRPHLAKQKNGKILSVKQSNYKPKAWDSKPAGEGYFDELFRISKTQIIWGINHFGFLNVGSGRIFWDKVNGASDYSDGEIAYCSKINSVRIFVFMWSGMRQGNPLNGRIMQGNKKLNETRIHPTQKPRILYRWLLRHYANPGDILIDTHVGSASSLIEFEANGFDYVGFEIDKDYYQAAQKRIKLFRQQPTLWEQGKGQDARPDGAEKQGTLW